MSHHLIMRFFVVALLLGCPSMAAIAETTVIRANRLLDVDSGEVRMPGVVVVEGERILDINPETVAEDVTIVDLGDATLIPGLIDMHVHLMDDPGSDWIAQRAYETPATWALRAAKMPASHYRTASRPCAILAPQGSWMWR